MKRIYSILLFACCLGLVSCELESSDNGNLDGFWQLYQTDTLTTGGVTDMRSAPAYWAVQHHLLEIKHVANTQMNVLFSFAHQGDSLILSDPYFNNRDSSDIKITDAALLHPYGISRLRESFFVEQLNGNRMRLRTDRLRFHFRKY
jgi:hypothetical protein